MKCFCGHGVSGESVSMEPAYEPSSAAYIAPRASKRRASHSAAHREPTAARTTIAICKLLGMKERWLFINTPRLEGAVMHPELSDADPCQLCVPGVSAVRILDHFPHSLIAPAYSPFS